MPIKEITDILEIGAWVPDPPSNADLKRVGLSTNPLGDAWGEFVAIWRTREVFVGQFSFALPSAETVQAIRGRTTRLLDVGAGTGFWSHVIDPDGTTIMATDLGAGETQQVIGAFRPVLTMDGATAVRAHPDRDVLCVWPTLGSGWLKKVAEAMESERLLFYVGEWGGCTADDATHAYLSEAFDPVDLVAIPLFPGIRDRLHVMRKR